MTSTIRAARRVEYRDLLGVPFLAGGDDPDRGLDCWGLAAEVCRRLGLELPRPGRSTRGLEFAGESWRSATCLGDLLASDLGGGGLPSHVSVVVDVPRRLVLSCSEREGPYVVPAWALANVVGVWRAKP